VVRFVNSFRVNVNSILDDMKGVNYFDENTNMNMLNSKSKNKRVETKSTNNYVKSRLKCILDDLDELSNKLN
jgi:hypothetical protein